MEVTQALLDQLGITRVREAADIVEYRLDSNRLKILLAENHASPVVTVMPVYRVGSRNEAVGYTGATHLLEHMMFKGVKDGRTGEIYNFPELLKPVGGAWNATTWYDRTNYFETVPSQYLELCIAAESDRMRNLLLREDERASEMTVVRNELERGENDPTRVLLQEAYAVAFRAHPYHHPTIGWVSDVESISMDRLKWFYDLFYWPDNTSLLIMGDFDPAQALTLVAKYYSVHSRSPQPIPQVITTEPKQEGERRFTIKRAGDAARVVVAFHVPEATHADDHALAVMGNVLGSGSKSSRLYKALVDTRMAASASVWHFEQRDPGLFLVFATVAPDVKVEDVESVILCEIEKLAKEPPSEDELRRVKRANRKRTQLASADPMEMANIIAEAESVADWTFFVNYDDNFDAVTAADVQRVASTYFDSDNRTVGHFIPTVKAAVDNPPALEEKGEGTPQSDAAAATSSFAARTHRVTLDNGLTLLVMPSPTMRNVGISGKLRVGGVDAPSDKPLVAALAAAELTSGSKTRTAQQISDTLEEMGTGLRFTAGNFTTSFNTELSTLDLEELLTLIADLLRNPAYPQQELDTTKVRYASWFKRMTEDTDALARQQLVQDLYPKDSVYYDRSFQECLEELGTISVEDLKKFYTERFSPKEMILSVVGAVDLDKIVALVKKLFGDWTGPTPAAIKIEENGTPPERKRLKEVFVKDKPNASFIIGHRSPLKRTAEDFLAARLANAALGSDTISSRLGDAVRKKAGLTYGIYSRFEDTTFGGAPFTITCTVNPSNVEKAIQMVEQIVDQYVKEGISDKELANEAGSSAGAYLVRLRNAGDIASTLTEFEFLGMGAQAMDSYAADIQAVTKEQVNEALRKYIRPDQFVIAVAGSISNG